MVEENKNLEVFSSIPGVCYMYVKELEPAKEYLSKTLNFHKNEQSFMTLGKILLLQGDINGAIGKYVQRMHYVVCYFIVKLYLNIKEGYSRCKKFLLKKRYICVS